MFENLSTEKVMKMATRVGRQIAHGYSGIDAEDITGAILVHIAEKAPKMKSDDEDYVYRAMRMAGLRYAARERYAYIINSSQYIYTPSEVRALLKEAYFVEEMWQAPVGFDDRLSATVSRETVMVSLLDIQSAMDKLPPRHRDVIESTYGLNEEPANKMQVTRAIEDLTRHLNRHVNLPRSEHEGPGSRTSLSNAQAQYLTRNQW
jgi:DNA-directed RNA polymerase specialized sigma24 family protein